jgi:hypothetical protein
VLPGSRFATAVMIIVIVFLVLSLVLSAVAFPIAV